MSYFPTSSQRRKWTFDSMRLEVFHAENLQRAIEFAREQFSVSNSDKSVEFSTVTIDSDLSRGDPPTLEEEAKLRKFYERQLLALCTSLRQPHKVHGAALMFFKRFYVKKSMLENHPKGIMLTCIYLACKTEESYISSTQLAKASSQNVALIVNNELRVLNTLDFELVVFTPYRPLRGFLLDFNRAAELPLSEEQVEACYNTARSYADHLMLTDAPLLFPPAQLAYCALLQAAKDQSLEALGEFLHSTAATASPSLPTTSSPGSMESGDRNPSPLPFTPPKDNLPVLDRLLKQGAALLDEQEVRNIDMKLRLWKIPSSKENKEGSKRKTVQLKRMTLESDLSGQDHSGISSVAHSMRPVSCESDAKRRKSENSIEMRSPLGS